jgi:uncharacterized membrane protein YbjE (DUF340 family)
MLKKLIGTAKTLHLSVIYRPCCILIFNSCTIAATSTLQSMAPLNDTILSHTQKKIYRYRILLSIEVISRPLLLTKIIGVCCEKHTKSVYSKNSVLGNEARGTYSNH